MHIHKNGMTEKRIRELQELTCTILIHARRRWPKVVTANLWPYKLRMANNVMNEKPSFQNYDKKIPQAIFSVSQVDPNSKHCKTFVCLVYFIDSSFQATQPHQKWSEKSRVVVYLGTSPTHSTNVVLELLLKTGLGRPQFHVKFDTKLQTVGHNELSS